MRYKALIRYSLIIFYTILGLVVILSDNFVRKFLIIFCVIMVTILPVYSFFATSSSPILTRLGGTWGVIYVNDIYEIIKEYYYKE